MIAIFAIIMMALVSISGCIIYRDKECPEIPENQPPVIKLISPTELVEDYHNTRICFDISDPDGDQMKIQMYWSNERNWNKWIEISNVIGYNGSYCYPRGIPLYNPFVLQYHDRHQHIKWRVDVTDGQHIVSETYDINYLHPTIWKE